MRRFFVIVTPNCSHRQSIKVGSKECTQCDDFLGGIIENFVDCKHEPQQEKNVVQPIIKEQPAKKRGRPAKKANSKPVNKRNLKK